MLVAISIYWTPLVAAVVQPFSECRFPISAIKNLRTLEEKAELKGKGPQSSFPSGAAAETSPSKMEERRKPLCGLTG